MNKLYVLFCFLFCFSSLSSQTYYSIANSDWSNSNTWSTSSGGASCNCTPAASDDVVVESDIDLDISLTGGNGISGNLTIKDGYSLTTTTENMEVRSGGSLTVESNATLEVYDLTFYNGSAADIQENATVIVHGDFENRNNSDQITLDGSLTVHGDFENGNGGEISGSGILDVSGDFENSGSLFGCTGNDCCPSFPCSSSTLPIELIAFTASLDHNNSVTLEWATAVEINNDFFTIERSSNGLTFEVIAEIPGAGNSNKRLDYMATDETPVTGTSYYRLKQTDYDGKYEYSNLVAVNYEIKANGTCELKVYPNPCPGNCSIALSKCEENSNRRIAIAMYDAAGNKIYQNIPYREMDGSFSFHVNSNNNLAPGIYIVKASSENEDYSKKVVVR